MAGVLMNVTHVYVTVKIGFDGGPELPMSVYECWQPKALWQGYS